MLREAYKGRSWALLGAICMLICASSHAQTALFNEVHTIADVTKGVPVEHTFNVSLAGTYKVTLIDLGATLTPAAPLAAVKLAITSGATLVPLATSSGATTLLAAAGSAQFDATAGTAYVVHIVGARGTAPQSGPILVQINNVADNTSFASFSDTLAPPSTGFPDNVGTLDDTFTVASDGSYVVTLADLNLPQALPTLTLNIFKADGTVVTNPPLVAAGSITVSLQQGVNYRVIGAGLADAAVNAGLYSATVSPAGGGAAVYSKLVPVGAVAPVAAVTATGGESYTLHLTDLSFPNALTRLGAVVATNGQIVAQLQAAGTSQPFTSVAATYQLFVLGSTTTAGSYAVTLAPPSGPSPLSLARAVSAAGGSVPSAYSFDSTVTAAGSYTLDLTDFTFPTAFTSLSAVAVQNGAVLGTPLSTPGTPLNVTAAAGPVSILVFAQPAAAGSLFGVDLTAGGGASPAFETTQGVGQLFSARQVSITTAGSYAVNVSDVGFPASLASFAVVVTRGTSRMGSIFGGGAFAFPATTAGNYFINFIAQPGGSDKAGTYAMSVAAGPAVTLTSDPMSITTGATVHLTWTSQNTTACTASGGWTGSQILNGTATSAALTASTTFTLTCTGEGVTAEKSVTVSVADPPPKGGGGGGALGPGLLLLLVVVLLLRFVARGARGVAASIAILAGVALLTACGGAESRRASHIERGQAYFAKGDFAKASVEFRNAMQIAPKDPGARLLAAQTEEKLGHWREAAGLYQSVIDAVPDSVQAPAALGRLYDVGGAPERALKIVEPALAKHPDDADLLTVRGAARLKLKDTQGGRADAERAVQLAPTSETAAALLAGVYREAGDYARAVQLVEATLQKIPAAVDLREVLANLYLSAGDSAKGQEQLRKLIAQRPGEWRYRYELALFCARDHQLDDALRVLEDAVKALPKNDEAKLALVDFVTTQRTREQGEKTLRTFIAAEPDNYPLRLGLGALLQHAGATKEALDAYNEIIQRDGSRPNALVAQDRIAAIYVAERRFDDAEKIVAEVLRKNPRDNDSLLIRGSIALDRKDPATAITDLRAVLRDQPRSVAVHRALARAFVANGEPALAEEQLHAAIDIAPGDVSVRAELAELFLHTQRSEQAVALLEDAVRQAPSDGTLREALVRAYLAKRDLPAARTAAENLETLQPKSAAGPYFAGLVAQAQNRMDDAERDLERALQLQSNASEPLAALTRLQIARHETPKAIANLQKVLDSDPKNAFALDMLGEVFVSAKDFPRAIDALTRATAAAPKWWYAYRNLAVAKAGANDEPGAVAAYKAGISAAPGESLLVVELASYYEKKNLVDDAIGLYEALYQRNPRSPLAANNLATLLATYKTDQRSLDRARDLSSGFVSSNDGALLDTNGWVHFKRGEVQDALPVLERAVARVPDSRVVHYHLAMAELQAGQRDRARANLEAALAGSANFTGADHARSVLAGLKGRSG